MARDPVTEKKSTFEAEARAVLAQLRAALLELLAALPGRVVKTADLRRVLSIDHKLSWKVMKLATTANPLAAGVHVPTPVAFKTLLHAAARRRAPAKLIKAVAHAAEAFEELVTVHAGDRTTFDSMVSVYSDDEGAISLTHRRTAFRVNSLIWGVQAGTQLKCGIVRPGDDPSRLDVATLNGFLHLRQLRPSARLVISRVRNTDDDGNVLHGFGREALDPRGEAPHGLALLQDFCSQPLPEFRAVEADAGFTYGELIGAGVGNTGAITCIEGNVARSVIARYRGEHSRANQLCAGVHVPCETLVLDLLVQDGTYGTGVVKPEVAVYGEQSGGPPYPARSQGCDALPLGEAVKYLGMGPAVLHLPDVPRYEQMARYVFDRLQWDGEQFHVYRCRMAYPILPTTVVMRFDLPEAPPA
jgi:hypothetical protein